MKKIKNIIKRIIYKKEKYIVIGDRDYLYPLLNSFDKITDHIEFFIDDNNSNEYLLQLPIYPFDILSKKKYASYKFVIFNAKEYKKATNTLTKKYNINKESIIYGSEWLLHILKKYEDVLIVPKKLRVEVCSICQLNCVACYMRLDHNGTVGSGYMKLEDYKRLIDKYPFITEVEISNNGEPFINPEIDKIIEYSFLKNIRITVDNGTNFNNVTDATLEALVKCNAKSISLSIDGASNKTYKKYRVKGDFNKVIENVKKLNKYKELYGNGDTPYVIWKYILMQHNECDVEKAIEMSKKLGLHINFFQDWRGFIPKDPEKMKQLTGIDFLYKGKPQLYQEFCTYMFMCPQINWDGRLLGCCMTYKTDWHKNVFEDGLIESLNSDYYRHAIYKLLGDQTDYHEENQCTNNCWTYRDFIAKGKYVKL